MRFCCALWVVTVVVVVGAFLIGAGLSHAASPTPERVLELCLHADGPAHCGRLIEAEQLKKLPDLATRSGDTLRVTMFPSGVREFVDVNTFGSARSSALWDYWSWVNAVVLFTTAGERLGYAVLQRATGQLTPLPAEPVLSADRQRLAIADFCAQGCDNEVTVWRVARDGIRKMLAWKPAAPWSDVTVKWNEAADALAIEYTAAGDDKPRTVVRKLDAPGWRSF